MIHGSRWNTMIYQTLWQFLEHSCGKSPFLPGRATSGVLRRRVGAIAATARQHWSWSSGPSPTTRGAKRSRGRKGLRCTWERNFDFWEETQNTDDFFRMETEGWPRVALKYVETLGRNSLTPCKCQKSHSRTKKGLSHWICVSCLSPKKQI